MRLSDSNIQPNRTVPFIIAIIICLTLSIIIGGTAWLFFGKHPDLTTPEKLITTDSTTNKPVNTSSTDQPIPTVVIPAPAGELVIPDGVVSLGGDNGEPVRKIVVKSFAIAETETTNEQYREFIKETNHKPPQDWDGNSFLPGLAAMPVTGVSWQDAVDYCDWLSKKIGAQVHLPTEAEWELAARGKEGFKYPWGNSWNDRAATHAQDPNNGTVSPVKSYPEGKSPFGAYDMAGNVWEWTSDSGMVNSNSSPNNSNEMYKVVKGGSSEEEQKFISATSKRIIPASSVAPTLGFRYVLIRSNKTN